MDAGFSQRLVGKFLGHLILEMYFQTVPQDVASIPVHDVVSNEGNRTQPFTGLTG